MCRCRCSCLMFFSILYLLQSCNKDLDSHDAKSLVSYNTNLYSMSSKWENLQIAWKARKTYFRAWKRIKPSHFIFGIRFAELPNLISCFPLSLLCNHCCFSSLFFPSLFFSLLSVIALLRCFSFPSLHLYPLPLLP